MVSGGAAIKKYAVLNDKRHILTKDTDNNVAIYDVLKVTKVKDLGQVDFDNELKQHNQKVFIPNWFTVDLKTGVRTTLSLKENVIDGTRFEWKMEKKKKLYFFFLVFHRCQPLCWVPTKLIASVHGYQLKLACPNTQRLGLT